MTETHHPAVESAPEHARSTSPSQSRRASRAAFVGTLLEYYDFSLYASAATVVFASVFFSGSSPFLGTLQAVGTFAVGFLVRPLGGVILGSLGDRIGRKKILVLTLVLMGAATLLVGLLPSYAQIGWIAPLLLVLLRVVQGIGASAEYGGATLVAVEFAERRKRGLLGSLPGMGAALGGVLGTGALLLVSTVLSKDAFLDWGWRIPFLLSGLILAYGLWLRRALPETPEFRRIEDADDTASTPVRDVIRQQPRALVTVLGMTVGQTGIGYFYLVFMGTFGANQLGLDKTQILIGLIAAQVANAVLIPLFGGLSDRVGRRPVIMFGFAYSAVFAWLAFWLLSNHGSPTLFWVVLALGNGIGVAAIFGPMGAYVTELFDTKHAYSGLGLGRETGNALGAAVVPVVAVPLAFDDTTIWLSLLLCGIALLGLVAAVMSQARTEWAREQARDEVTVAT
ncbi:MFS transporter [Prescottella equi]|uniref:MFS transporter n=1 Tax=Rhodococcus hoagii TaxID=43767 RepID=UPI000A104877|nr:MFS transporter [Prescottella equi]ORL16006.1 MFS transporter [Prescottella equi]